MVGVVCTQFLDTHPTFFFVSGIYSIQRGLQMIYLAKELFECFGDVFESHIIVVFFLFSECKYTNF